MAGKKKNGPKAKAPAKAAKKSTDRKATQLRDKLTDAMQDPLTRDQMVRAIRAMMQEK